MSNPEPKKRGARKTTGKFETREALISMILMNYYGGNSNVSLIARSTGVSSGVVTKIIDENKIYVNCHYDDGDISSYFAPAFKLNNGEVDFERIKDYFNEKSYRGSFKVVKVTVE